MQSEITFVACPQCQARYETSITSIINVSDDPGLKQSFLQGQLNISQCPQCGFQSELNLPIFYHDGSKELALVFSPDNLQLSHADSQKIIGNLTNKLMNALPPEERKAYLFTPQTFLTLDSLRKAILEADGITEEMIQAQAAKIALLQTMLKITNQDELKKSVEENDAELDRQFFEILSSAIFNALNQGDHEQAQGLLVFRQMVAQWSSQGETHIAEIDKMAGFQPLTPDLLLENLKQADNDEDFVRLVRAGKPLIDYAFFQNLTSQIDALSATGNQVEAEKLKALRSRILDTSAQVDEENRKIISRVTKLLEETLKATDRQTFITENLAQFDEAFFSVLAGNIQEALQRGDQTVAQQLNDLQKQIMTIIQEKIPPELKLLTQLLEVEGPGMIKSLLEQNRALITEQFMNFLKHAETNFEGQGQTQLLDRLKKIKEEATALQGRSTILIP